MSKTPTDHLEALLANLQLESPVPTLNLMVLMYRTVNDATEPLPKQTVVSHDTLAVKSWLETHATRPTTVGKVLAKLHDRLWESWNEDWWGDLEPLLMSMYPVE